MKKNLKPVPAKNKGLAKLPKKVRNKMGLKDGGVVRGTARGGGAATKGLGYNVRPN
jgi:bifunctional DNA-binding transcriptional regulator/antitoxin component of YhaV-PrlF toxin-antitoxin module